MWQPMHHLHPQLRWSPSWFTTFDRSVGATNTYSTAIYHHAPKRCVPCKYWRMFMRNRYLCHIFPPGAHIWVYSKHIHADWCNWGVQWRWSTALNGHLSGYRLLDMRILLSKQSRQAVGFWKFPAPPLSLVLCHISQGSKSTIRCLFTWCWI